MLELDQSKKVPELYLEEDAFGGVNGRCSSIFETEARPRDCLPKNFPSDIPGTCHFLNGYRHPEY